MELRDDNRLYPTPRPVKNKNRNTDYTEKNRRTPREDYWDFILKTAVRCRMHTKYMLVDPLGAAPTMVTGNAIAVKIYLDKKKKGTPDDWKSQYLIDNDSWMGPYFDQADSSARYLRRVYFAGPMTA